MELTKELVKGYKQITLAELQSELQETYKESGKSYIDLAYELNVRSISTIQNVLGSDTQIVSDEILTRFVSLLGIEAFVMWTNGERNYFIKNGKI